MQLYMHLLFILKSKINYSNKENNHCKKKKNYFINCICITKLIILIKIIGNKYETLFKNLNKTL